jgi:YVTN family beta-propeller protein
MSRSFVPSLFCGLLSVSVLGLVSGCTQASPPQQVQAQEGTAPRADDQAARRAAAEAAKNAQEAFEKTIPKLDVTEQILPLVIPGHTMGETEGVSMNSKGHLFVYSRTGKGGIARGGTAAELFEFDPSLKFVKLWGEDNYAASFAHSVRIDKYDNVWMVDEGSDMIIEFNPDGRVIKNLGRKPEAIDYLQSYLERGERVTNIHPVGTPYTFNRETDIAWDEQDNMYISDGYGDSRAIKLDKDGTWVKAVGTYGSGANQFSTPHSIAYMNGNVYVADRGNNRVQVYDTSLNFKKSITGLGSPWAVCTTPSKKYLYSGDGTTGKVYKYDADGKELGWAQTSLNQGQSGCLIHEIHCQSDTVVYKGACGLWNVEKLTFKQ